MKTKNHLTLTEIKMNQHQEAAKIRAADREAERAQIEQDRFWLLSQATKTGVGIVHIFDQEDPKGGLTVAYRKSSPYKSGVMVEVAVATCSREDTFSRKTGTSLALSKFFANETIYLPLLNRYDGQENLATKVKWAFEALYFSV